MRKRGLLPTSSRRLVLVAAIALSACSADEPGRPAVRVFAAASATDVVTALAARRTDLTLVPIFGGSSALARQILDGAPADVFLSASPRWTDALRDAGALLDPPVLVAGNRLVAIAPASTPWRAGDAAELLARLADGDRVAIADAGVPAGEYARAALTHFGLADAYRPRLVGLGDVRAVLHAVELDEASAGFVYSTDAAAVDDVRVLFSFAPGSHPPIEYRAAVLRGAADVSAARRFVAALGAEPARSLLAAAGFVLPEPPTAPDADAR